MEPQKEPIHNLTLVHDGLCGCKPGTPVIIGFANAGELWCSQCLVCVDSAYVQQVPWPIEIPGKQYGMGTQTELCLASARAMAIAGILGKGGKVLSLDLMCGCRKFELTYGK